MKLAKCVDNKGTVQAQETLIMGKVYTIQDENVDFYFVENIEFFKKRFRPLEGNEKIINILYGSKT